VLGKLSLEGYVLTYRIEQYWQQQMVVNHGGECQNLTICLSSLCSITAQFRNTSPMIGYFELYADLEERTTIEVRSTIIPPNLPNFSSIIFLISIRAMRLTNKGDKGKLHCSSQAGYFEHPSLATPACHRLYRSLCLGSPLLLTAS